MIAYRKCVVQGEMGEARTGVITLVVEADAEALEDVAEAIAQQGWVSDDALLKPVLMQLLAHAQAVQPVRKVGSK